MQKNIWKKRTQLRVIGYEIFIKMKKTLQHHVSYWDGKENILLWRKSAVANVCRCIHVNLAKRITYAQSAPPMNNSQIQNSILALKRDVNKHHLELVLTMCIYLYSILHIFNNRFRSTFAGCVGQYIRQQEGAIIRTINMSSPGTGACFIITRMKICHN